MGNRAYLTLGSSGQFEANNCLPITWLALFNPSDFRQETRDFDGDLAEIVCFQTTAGQAQQNIQAILSKITLYPHILRYLWLLKLLYEELQQIPEEIIELDVSEWVAINEQWATLMPTAPQLFQQLCTGFSGDEAQDLALLTQFVNQFKLDLPVQSLHQLNNEELSWLLVGFFEGEEALEEKYSPSFFKTSYEINPQIFFVFLLVVAMVIAFIFFSRFY